MNAFSQPFGGHRNNVETYVGDGAQHTFVATVDGVQVKKPASLYAAYKAAADGMALTAEQLQQLSFEGIGLVDTTNKERERVANKMLAEGGDPATINAHLKTIPRTLQADKSIRFVTAFKSKAF